MDPKVDDELIQILKNSSLSVEARSQGWNFIISLSATSDGIRHIVNSGKYMPFILSSIMQENEEKLKKQAFQSLINISSEPQGQFAIAKCRKDFCNYLLNSVAEQNSRFVEYKCQVLSNMSTNPDFCEQIVHILLSTPGLYQKLVSLYFSDDAKLRKQFDFLTLVFANVSRLSAGRRLFILDFDFMNKIIGFTKSSEPESRRLGTALILRNCCLETEYHERLLNFIEILPALLLPLMVPQQYEEGGEMGKLPPDLQQQCLKEAQERDKSTSVRRVLVEALTVLCYSEIGWRFLKTNGVYYVVRDLHAWETDPVSKESIEQLVSYFLVVEYSKPEALLNESSTQELIKQLEYDITNDLPDFVIEEGLKGW